MGRLHAPVWNQEAWLVAGPGLPKLRSWQWRRSGALAMFEFAVGIISAAISNILAGDAHAVLVPRSQVGACALHQSTSWGTYLQRVPWPSRLRQLAPFSASSLIASLGPPVTTWWVPVSRADPWPAIMYPQSGGTHSLGRHPLSRTRTLPLLQLHRCAAWLGPRARWTRLWVSEQGLNTVLRPTALCAHSWPPRLETAFPGDAKVVVVGGSGHLPMAVQVVYAAGTARVRAGVDCCGGCWHPSTPSHAPSPAAWAATRPLPP